jgi:hypothetical protein
METRKALGVMAGIVLLIGIALALWPTHIAGGRVSCGSALSPDSTDAIRAEFGDALSDIYAGGKGSDDSGYTTSCQDRVGTQKTIAFSIVGLGVLAGVFLMLTSKGHPVEESAPAENTTSEG